MLPSEHGEVPLLAWDRSRQPVAPITLCTACAGVKVRKGSSSLHNGQFSANLSPLEGKNKHSMVLLDFQLSS